MATGHTHRVIDGEVTTLSEFAYECSKSFVSSWRDGKELAYPPARDSYYLDELTKRLRELTVWDNTTEEEKYVLWSDMADRQIAAGEEAKAEAKKVEAKIVPLLEEVLAARKNIPDTHNTFHEFMVTQLREALSYDGKHHPEYYEYQDYVTYVTKRRGELTDQIRYYSDQLAKAQESNTASRAWISTFATLYGLEVKEP